MNLFSDFTGRNSVFAVALSLFLGFGLAPATAQVPAAWLMSGANADLYTMRLDRDVVHSGESSLQLRAQGKRDDEEWAVSVQIIDASAFRGRRVRLAGFLRSDDLGSGGLWMRVDGIVDGEAAQIVVDNTDDRRLSGDQAWTHQEIVLDITPQSVTILYGAMIIGNGSLWIDGLSLEAVEDDAPVTAEATNTVLGGAYERPLGMLPGPANLDFEVEAEGS